jgi:ABC-type amino acid transport substrate-binding protein
MNGAARRSRWRYAACVLCCLVGAQAAAASATTTLERIRQREAIVFAYRGGAMPFSFRDRHGVVRGYSVDLCMRVANAVRRELGMPDLRIEWVEVNSDTRVEAVASGRADAECGTTTISLSRMERVDFSVPIFVDGATLVVPAASKAGRLADLAGRRIAVIRNTTTHRALLPALELAGATATLLHVATPQEGVAALKQGQADAFASDRMVLTQIAVGAGDDAIRLLPDDFSFEPYAIVVARNDADFRLVVNRALVDAYRRGDIDPIFQRWLAPLGKPSALLNAMFYLHALPD